MDEDIFDRVEQETRSTLEESGALLDVEGNAHGIDELMWWNGSPQIMDSWEAAVNTANAFNTILKPYGDREIIPVYFAVDGARGKDAAVKFAVVEAKYSKELGLFEVEFVDKLASFFNEYAKMGWARVFMASR